MAVSEKLRNRIRNTWQVLSDGHAGRHVKISDLRDFIDLAPADLDAALTELYLAQVIDLVPQSCQQALTKADRAAAVRVGGEDKHRICWTSRAA